MKSINPYQPCLCGSNKKAKFCCLDGKVWNKKPTLISQDTHTVYSHPKCYSNLLQNCSSEISKEHYISKNILEHLKLDNKVKVIGLKWQEAQHFNLLSVNSLVSNILCIYHNNVLSPFDNEMGRFFRTIYNYDQNLNIGNQNNEVSLFCGEDLERWMLKTICGFIASKLVTKDKVLLDITIEHEFLEILFQNKSMPKGWGLYYKIPEDKLVHHYHSISFKPLTNNNKILGAEFAINNFIFYLLLSVPDNPKSFGIYRPLGIKFKHGTVTKTMEIFWQDKTLKEGIVLERSHSSSDYPSNWDDYLKK